MMEERLLTEYYKQISNKLNDIIPCEWERIVLFAEELEDVSFVTFYFYTIDGIVHHCGDISEEYGIDSYGVDIGLFELTNINKELLMELKKAEEELWYSYVFEIYSDGRFQMKYNYEYDEDMSLEEKESIWVYEELGLIPGSKYEKRILKKYLEEQGKELPEELKEI